MDGSLLMASLNGFYVWAGLLGCSVGLIGSAYRLSSWDPGLGYLAWLPGCSVGLLGWIGIAIEHRIS